jgi:hypothetical protein
MTSPKKRQASRHARGYTNAHIARRRRLEPLVASGQVACCRCGQLIELGQPWHLATTAAATSAPPTPPATSAPPRTRRTAREKIIR